MALFFPPSLSINQFSGGYKAVSDYTDLGDTETNDAVNVEYYPSGDISTRSGSLKINPISLKSTGGASGRPITGHYYFVKTGQTSTFHVVGAGDSLFNYNSSTSVAIRTGLTDNSETYWQFTQIQDPLSAGDDVILATNGVDPIQFWNGSNTAILLSSLTSATQVPIAKYIINHKNRIYAANIVDQTDSDAVVKVAVTGFGPDAAADPHRFRDSFYVGGFGKQGEITSIRVLNDQIIIYTKNSIWKFSPGAGNQLDTSLLQQLQETIGVLAPFSLVDIGGAHIFLSQNGVFIFNGINLQHLSVKIDEELLKNCNKTKLHLAKAEFDKTNNHYILYYPSSGSTRNNRALKYDTRLGLWNPPITGRYVNYISSYETTDRISNIIYGDYFGYLYQDGVGINDGVAEGINGTPTAVTNNTLTASATAGNPVFATSTEGYAGLVVRITSGPGEGQEQIVTSSDSQTLTIEGQWKTLPTSASTFSLAAIPAYFKTKDYSFGQEDTSKLFREIRVRTKEKGAFNMIVTYIIDFKTISRATSALISLVEDGMAWGFATWGDYVWGGKRTITKKISLRSTDNQSLIGAHLGIKFETKNANSPWVLRGFDVTLKRVGKR